jgi:formylglycine-generating enzyme
MHDEQSFLQAMQQHPEDNALRLVFADWLEEQGDKRGELIRLLHTLTQSIDVPDRSKLEDRLRSLVTDGVMPIGPFVTNSIGMKFAWIPAGTFMMGSPENEEGRRKDETQHKVTLTKGFWLAIHPTTQASWQSVISSNPSHFKGDDLPVEQVSWEDCQNFLRRLSERDARVYRLPTEAEWEYACRAGTTTPFSLGETISADQANYDGNYSYGKGKKGVCRERTTPACSFPANAWGLYDMHGNVGEWCQDIYSKYPKEEVIDPQGPMDGDRRVLRGGSFGLNAEYGRSASRLAPVPAYRNHGNGFRAAAMTSEPMQT